MPCPRCGNDRCHVLIDKRNSKNSIIIATCTKCGFTVKGSGPESEIKKAFLSGLR